MSNFIKGAIKHPGALHKELGVKQGQKIPSKKLAAARAGKYGPKAEKRAQFAKELAGFHKGGKSSNPFSKALSK